ncbi:hypothetical protein ACFV3R_19380 [Streptomyces sp. NPDC059740]|uniref:hypothetical protein n=1 Tax=Streptomyces sp. NPDC059740 TaxID=3346926 RepID=UPI0036591C9D
MSGDNYHFGDSVTVNGGRGNIGMIKNQSAPAGSQQQPELQEALGELRRLLTELRGQVSPVSAEAIDESLPDIGDEGEVQPRARHRALLAVAGIAATVGEVGRPALEAVNKVLELLGAR